MAGAAAGSAGCRRWRASKRMRCSHAAGNIACHRRRLPAAPCIAHWAWHARPPPCWGSTRPASIPDAMPLLPSTLPAYEACTVCSALRIVPWRCAAACCLWAACGRMRHMPHAPTACGRAHRVALAANREQVAALGCAGCLISVGRLVDECGAGCSGQCPPCSACAAPRCPVLPPHRGPPSRARALFSRSCRPTTRRAASTQVSARPARAGGRSALAANWRACCRCRAALPA